MIDGGVGGGFMNAETAAPNLRKQGEIVDHDLLRVQS